MKHVALITTEILCGIDPHEVNREDFVLYDGTRCGPIEDVTCAVCQATLMHIVSCLSCHKSVADGTRYVINQVRASGVDAQDAEAVEAELAKHKGEIHYDQEPPASDRAIKEFKWRQQVRRTSDLTKLLGVLGDLKADVFKLALPPAAPVGVDKASDNEDENTGTLKFSVDDPTHKEEEREMNAETKKVTVVDVDVLRSGDKLVIPEGLSIKDAVSALTRKAAEEEQEIAVSHDFNMTPPEGAIAFLRTLNDMFGFISPASSPGFFGPQPPTFLSIETAPGVTESVPWGRMMIPGIQGYLQPGISWVSGAPYFRLMGNVRGRNKAMVQKIADNMRARVDSLYRGKAIYAAFPEMDENTPVTDFFPTFMSLPDIPPSALIFSDDTQALIDTALFTPIEYSDECRKQGISLKRGILLEGPYGTGKTLTATITARKCVENGWTFIYLRNVADLPRAIHFAKTYAPAAIFAEDIDQVLKDPDTRDEEVNDILNSIDGIDSKGVEILTVLTTNNVEKITTAMLRPGRLDTVVSVRPPDAKAAIRLVQLFAGDQLAAGQDFTAVGEQLKGCIPAMIQEVVKRSKLGAVRRAAKGGVLEITSNDVEIAATSMIAHMKLLEPKIPDIRSDRERAAHAYGESMGQALAKAISGPLALPNGSATKQPTAVA